MNFSALCSFGDVQSSNPTVYAVNIYTFCGDTAKIGISVKCLRISWTYLDLLYRSGRCIGGDDYPDIRWRSPKGHCCGNQLNLGDVR